MASFDGIDAVAADLEYMSGGPEPLVLRLSRRPGQKEERWAQLLTPERFDASGDGASQTRANRMPDPGFGAGTSAPPLGANQDLGEPIDPLDSPADTPKRLTALIDEVAELRTEVAALRAALEQLQATANL